MTATPVVPMTPDQVIQAQAIQAALADAKTALQAASVELGLMRTKSNTMMADLKATRPDAYNAAFRSKAIGQTLKGKTDALLGEVMQGHADVSEMLMQYFTDAAQVVQAGPGR